MRCKQLVKRFRNNSTEKNLINSVIFLLNIKHKIDVFRNQAILRPTFNQSISGTITNLRLPLEDTSFDFELNHQIEPFFTLKPV